MVKEIRPNRVYSVKTWDEMKTEFFTTPDGRIRNKSVYFTSEMEAIIKEHYPGRRIIFKHGCDCTDNEYQFIEDFTIWNWMLKEDVLPILKKIQDKIDED